MLDGPYGVPIDHTRYDRILLVAGGIGITPVLSTFRGLYHLAQDGLCDVEQVKLVWVARYPKLFLLAENTFIDIQDDDRFGANLFVSDPFVTHNEVDVERDPKFARVKGCIRSMEDKPNLREELLELAPLNSRTLLFVCGPRGLSDACAKLALAHHVHFHSETFSK